MERVCGGKNDKFGAFLICRMCRAGGENHRKEKSSRKQGSESVKHQGRTVSIYKNTYEKQEHPKGKDREENTGTRTV